MKTHIAVTLLGLACSGAAITASAQAFYSVVNPGLFSEMTVTLVNPDNSITAQVSGLDGNPLLVMNLTPQGYVNINDIGMNNNSGQALEIQFSAAITSFQINWAAYNNGETPNILDLNASLAGDSVGTSTSASLLTDSSGYDEGTAVYSNAGGFDSLAITWDASSDRELICLGGDAAGTGGFGNQTVATPTPEPSTLALAGLGALSLLLYRRRK